MDKIQRPRGLVRYASLNSIERGEPFSFTARMAGYLGVLGAPVALLSFPVFTRSEVETILLRAPGSLFQMTGRGRIENLYLLKIINKTSRDIPLQLRLDDPVGDLRVMGAGYLIVPKEKLAQTSVL